MEERLLQRHLRLHAGFGEHFRLEGVIHGPLIERLRSTVIRSTRRHSKQDNIDSLSPGHFLNKYREWLSQSLEFFSTGYELSKMIDSIEINHIAEYCKNFNDFFEGNCAITYGAKKYVEKKIESFSCQLNLTKQEANHVFFNGVLSANYVHDRLMHHAKRGSESSFRYLVEYFHLNSDHLNNILKAQKTPLKDSNLNRNWHTKCQVYLSTNSPESCIRNIIVADHLNEAIIWRLGNHRLPMLYLFSKIDTFLLEKYSDYPKLDGVIDLDLQRKFLKKIGMEV